MAGKGRLAQTPAMRLGPCGEGRAGWPQTQLRGYKGEASDCPGPGALSSSLGRAPTGFLGRGAPTPHTKLLLPSWVVLSAQPSSLNPQPVAR